MLFRILLPTGTGPQGHWAPSTSICNYTGIEQHNIFAHAVFFLLFNLSLSLAQYLPIYFSIWLLKKANDHNRIYYVQIRFVFKNIFPFCMFIYCLVLLPHLVEIYINTLLTIICICKIQDIGRILYYCYDMTMP